MQMVRNNFDEGQIAYFAVNWKEPLEVVADYIGDTGLRAPVLLDNSDEALAGCHVVPAGADTLTEHYQLQIGNPDIDPPFPLHVVIDGEGNFAYLARDHDPEALLAVLQALVDE